MIYKNLKEIPFTHELGVIINVGTKKSTTLALLSAIKYLNIPILLIDCEVNKNDDFLFFTNLQTQYNFHLIQLPLRKHGETLDIIFKEINSNYLVLIDSDLEILTSDYFLILKKLLTIDNTFGAGFIHGPLKRVKNQKNAHYIERMWIPFTLLNVEKVKFALNNKLSFNIRYKFNDFPISQYISKRIYKVLLKLNFDIAILNIFRKKYGSQRPSLVLYDTGADIYQFLKDSKYFYWGLNSAAYSLFVNHFDGITRNLLDKSDFTGLNLSSVDEIITKRLIEEYNFKF